MLLLRWNHMRLKVFHRQLSDEDMPKWCKVIDACCRLFRFDGFAFVRSLGSQRSSEESVAFVVTNIMKNDFHDHLHYMLTTSDNLNPDDEPLRPLPMRWSVNAAVTCPLFSPARNSNRSSRPWALTLVLKNIWPNLLIVFQPVFNLVWNFTPWRNFLLAVCHELCAAISDGNPEKARCWHMHAIVWC